jgi:hypothetical protein
MTAGEEGVAAWGADPGGGMAVGEAQAFLGELIQAGSGDLGLLVVAAEIAKTEIVAVENQDIGECCLGGEKREAGRENEQGKGTSHPEITGRNAPIFKRALTFRTTLPVGGGFDQIEKDP